MSRGEKRLRRVKGNERNNHVAASGRPTGGKNQLTLEDLEQRHRALTPFIAGAYKEAAEVCLSRHHVSPTEVMFSDSGRREITEMSWFAPDDRTRDAWANSIDATEAGAYCCVILGVEVMRGLFAVRRADTGTGADYYIGKAGSGKDDLEDCVRLEVSGVDAADSGDVRKRVLAKVRQASEGKSSLPAIAGVFGFAAKLLIIQDVTEQS